MQSKTNIRGHAAHPIWVLFPITFYVAPLVTLICFVLTHAFAFWEAALWSNVLAVGLALVAAVPGALDLVGIVPRDHDARPLGWVHAVAGVFGWQLVHTHRVGAREVHERRANAPLGAAVARLPRH